MPANFVKEISEKAAMLPPERQLEALAYIERLGASAEVASSCLPRPGPRLKGATAQGQSVSAEEIEEARREMWGDYMGEDQS